MSDENDIIGLCVLPPRDPDGRAPVGDGGLCWRRPLELEPLPTPSSLPIPDDDGPGAALSPVPGLDAAETEPDESVVEREGPAAAEVDGPNEDTPAGADDGRVGVANGVGGPLPGPAVPTILWMMYGRSSGRGSGG